MEKYCKRREGCMLMFINIFGYNQKHLLMDKKLESKRFTDSNNEKKKKKKKKQQLICSCESSNENVQTLIDDEHVCKNSANESEEKFNEIIKRLIARKEGEIQTCKDLLEAFHVLDSEEESLLKKKKKKSSLEDVQSRGDSKRVEEEDKLKEAVIVSHTKCSFFSRKWRSEERRNRSRVGKRIVVLKPILDVDDSPSNKSKTGRCFLIGLIKRRLQSCVEKKSCDVLDCVQEEIQSKSEEHFPDDEAEPLCNERMSEDSKKIMSRLYIAAKKHLSEMLANGDIDVNLPDKEVPRILGKILSLPEFSSPTNSPSPLSQTTEKQMMLQCSSSTSDMINEDTDETLFSIDVSVPKGHGKETCSSSVSRQVKYVEEVAVECGEEDRDNQSLNKETFSQAYDFPPESPPSSSVMMTDSKEAAIDVQGKLSPVSVLEPLLTDDENSPRTSTNVEMRIQPLCIRFNEADSPKPDKDNNVKTGMDEKQLTLAYIEAVVKSSGLNLEELLTRSFYSEPLLETTDEVVFCSAELCDDKNLLHDCINEVLMDFCRNDLNPGPWISFVKPEVQLIADVEIAAKVAQEGVYWHLLPLPSPHAVDQMISKDMAKTGSWMDLRFDIGCIGSDIGEMILDELVEEVIRSCIDIVQAEANQDRNIR